MNPAAIIEKARAGGIDLEVTPDYRLRIVGSELKPEQVDFLKANRDPIIDQLCVEQFQFEVLRITLPDDVGFIVKQLQSPSSRNGPV